MIEGTWYVMLPGEAELNRAAWRLRWLYKQPDAALTVGVLRAWPQTPP